MTELEPKGCPHLVGPCRRERCHMWVEFANDCCYVLAVTRDEVLMAALMDVENFKLAAQEASDTAELQAEVIHGFENKVASMVPLVSLEEALANYDNLSAQFEGLKEELADAKQCVTGLEGQVALMVSRELYQEADSGWKEALELGAKLQEELKDVRAELEAIGAKGSKKARRKKKPIERES